MEKEKYLFVEYPACGTCKKTAKWLKENNIEVVDRNIKEENPTKNELKSWIEKSKLPIAKFFNTSGKIYKENNLKVKVAEGDTEELLSILSSDGMVVKRPILVGENFVLVGFKEDEWRKQLL